MNNVVDLNKCDVKVGDIVFIKCELTGFSFWAKVNEVLYIKDSEMKDRKNKSVVYCSHLNSKDKKSDFYFIDDVKEVYKCVTDK